MHRKMQQALVLALAMGTAVPAMAQQMTCTMRTIGEQLGWIADQIALDISPDGKQITVSDAVIQNYLGDVQYARVHENTPARLGFRWHVDGVSTTRKIVRMTYSATLLRASNQLRITASDGAYPEVHVARGDCSGGAEQGSISYSY